MADAPANDAPYRLLVDVIFGHGVIVGPFTNLYGCEIASGTRIGPYVEIQRDVRVGERCKIQSHTFVCSGVEIADEVFVGHGVMFINDKRPRATNDDGGLQDSDDWECLTTVIEHRASIGSGAVVLGGVRIGAGALIGAGAVVTQDVAPREVVAGVPARALLQAHPNG
jgi:acetyltransferase-like isoleucine patch superfamily enzyme